MIAKTQYRSHQRDKIVEYLKTISGEHVTADNIYLYFQEKGDPIGKATVYRQLERLVEQGVLNKYQIDRTSPACFELSGEHFHQEENSCFHCKCEKCGKLIHLHCKELEGIGQHLQKCHQFTLDPMRAVFYGICEECKTSY